VYNELLRLTISKEQQTKKSEPVEEFPFVIGGLCIFQKHYLLSTEGMDIGKVDGTSGSVTDVS
jgi:hypothetical protein